MNKIIERRVKTKNFILLSVLEVVRIRDNDRRNDQITCLNILPNARILKCCRLEKIIPANKKPRSILIKLSSAVKAGNCLP